MHFKTRCGLGAAALSIAALVGASPAAAQPSVCSTRAFKAVDAAVKANPQGTANLLAFTYRFAARPTMASFDTLAQCDASTAQSVFNDFQASNPAEASSFETAFKGLYPADASSVFGSSSGSGGGLSIG